MNIIKSIKFVGGLANVMCKTVSVTAARSSVSKVVESDFPSLFRSFSSLTTTLSGIRSNGINLTPINLSVVPSCGMKVKGKLKRRCKKCYFARIDGRMHVLCDAYPRHKQMALVKREKYTWIITSCSQSKLRPY